MDSTNGLAAATGRKRLEGLVVAITRTADAGTSMADDIRAQGGEPVWLPCVELVYSEPTPKLKLLWDEMDRFDRVLVGSPAALNVFTEYPVPSRRISVTCVGEATAEKIRSDPALNERFIVAEVATRRRAEGMLEVLRRSLGSVKGKRFLMPRPPEGRTWLLEALAVEGAEEVQSVETYRINCAKILQPLVDWARIDIFTFLSGRTLSCFLEIMTERGRDLLHRRVVAVIGPVAKQQAELQGVRVDVMPDRASSTALVEALAKYAAHGCPKLAVPRRT
ncbi:MAG: uroporphyrinogen-III synthase [Myxococcales bacterium]|nr:uroporphyrinogen-III synthase [Myxococcales bacterium]